MHDPFSDISTKLDKRAYSALDVTNATIEQLLVLRQQIDAKLPFKTLADVDVAHELVIQLQQVKILQSAAMEDEDTPVNQRAQAANSVASVLVSLTKLQNETYTSERLKKIERILIEAIADLPDDTQERFLSEYEGMLEGLS